MSRRKNKKQISFEDVLQKYNLKDYTNASALLKKAKIKPEEAGHAKQLRITLNLQIAFQYFQQHNYELAIKNCMANRMMKAKEGFLFSFEKHDILAGISHLYLGNFAEAEKCLSHTLESKNTNSFSFYYLLARLFKGDYIDKKSIAQFKKELPVAVNNLSENKQLFLQAMFYLQKNNKSGAVKILQNINAVSHSQKINLNAIISFLTNKKITASSSLKPLYKILFKFNLEENERIYLTKFPILKEKVEGKVKTSSVSQIKTAIKALCETGKPMSETVFTSALKQLDSSELEDSKYLIFNQFTALIHKNRDRNYKRIENILAKFYKELFQIPESIYSYFLYIHDTERIIEEADFYKFIIYYLEQNVDFLSDFAKNNISMKIMNNLVKNESFGDLQTAFKKITSLNKKYNLIGFSLYLTCVNIFRKQNTSENFKHLLEHEFFPQFGSEIASELYDVMHSVEASFNEELNFFNIQGVGVNTEFDTKIFVKDYLAVLMNALISDLNLSKKSKDVLKIYTLINNFLKRKEVIKHISQKNINKFIASYEERIKLFGENKRNSPYQKDILELQAFLDKEKLREIIIKGNNLDFKKLIDKYLEDDKIDIVLNVLKKVLSEIEQPFIFFSKTFYLFNELHKKYDKNKFTEKVKIINADYYDVVNILKFALKNHKKGEDEVFVYDLCEILISEVYKIKENNKYFYDEEDKILDPESYNLVIDFLKFVISADKKNQEFTYSLRLIKELVDDLEKVNIKKEIKKIKTAYNSALEYFKITKEIDKAKINKLIESKNYKGLEEYYLKEHIEKNTAKLFQDYIFNEIIKNYYPSDTKNRLIFLFIKVYIDNYPEKTNKEYLDIIAPYIQERYYINIAKFVAQTYPKYASFYYPIYENYIKPFLAKVNMTNARIIANFVIAVAKAKNNSFDNYDKKLIKDAIKYVKPFLLKKGMTSKMKKNFRTASIILDENITQNTLF